MSLYATLSKHSAQLPEILQAQAQQFCQQLTDKLLEDDFLIEKHQDFIASILKVSTCSQFISDNWLRHPDVIIDLVQSGDLFTAERRNDYSQALSLINVESESQLAQQLRQFRRREMLRIAWRDLAGWAELDETLCDLTALAEASIETALAYIYQYACQRWGTPTLADGRPFNLVILGMGKLGAWELNFSSDIDLILAYAESGTLTEKKEISYEEFFSRMTRSLVKVIDEITVDGFVFRTDLRLRPFGDSGPLVMSFAGMEHYYLTQAREWERYAMIKARQVAGDRYTGKQLTDMIKPFVYRRYLDYGAFAELRSLKFQIMQELKRKDKLENIKLGPGGIREVEFIGQAFQLIRGGQDAVLQQREIQVILTALADLSLMSTEDVAALKFAYRFLRRVENHIQEYQDKQSHDLPTQAKTQAILAYSLDFEDWASFKQTLDQVRYKVHSIFQEVFSLTDSSLEHDHLLWNCESDDEQALEFLSEYGFNNPIIIMQLIVDFKDNSAIRRLSNKASQVVQRLLPALIAELSAGYTDTDILKRILALFIAVAGRNVYLALLLENPQALAQLVKLSAASPWISQFLAQYPILFDELLDARTLYAPLQKTELNQDCQRALNKLDTLDEERIMICLRQFKHQNVLRVAAADLMDFIPVTVVSDYLTWIAEAVLNHVVAQAWLLMGNKYGFPPGTDEQEIKHFAIVAFGKLGGIELGYGSDLDLLFLSNYPDDQSKTTGDNPISSSLFFLRLGQKVRHLLNTKMLSGVLYEVDLRLRPNGDSGLLVTHLDTYEDYLLHHAWTWEHQALVRARFVAGDSTLSQPFNDIRQRILALPRAYDSLKTQVREMREKMLANLNGVKEHEFDLKHSAGGITDIEFLVQFGVLAKSAEHDQLNLFTDNLRLLEALKQQDFCSAEDAELLKQAYCSYRDYGHRQLLKEQSVTIDNQIFAEFREKVQAIWQKVLGE